MTADEFVQEWLVGKDEGCDVRVSNDDYVSGTHCLVAKTAAGRYFVRDMGSTNGTYFGTPQGRVRVTGWAEITPGVTLVIGRSEISWRP